MKKYNVGWGLTNLCNMNCQFCYSKETRIKSTDTSIKDWKRFVDDNHEWIDSINYGTGENAIIDDFFYFIEYVREKYPEIIQSVTSNGYIGNRLQNNRMFREIFMKSIDEIDISIDFADKQKHCDFRGQSNAFDWAIQTLEMLKDKPIKRTIVFLGFEDTMKKDNIDGLFELAYKYNTLLRLNIYRPVSQCTEINQRFMLKYDSLISALEYINENYQIVGLSDILIGSLYSNDASIKENTGIGSLRILPNGSICPSTYLVSDEYSSRYSIKESAVLSKIKYEDFENAPIPQECTRCQLVNKCRGGVFDRRLLWYGTLQERDPYCPERYGLSIPDKKFSVSKHGRISVHDEYLPTMFFKNKENM